MNELCFLDTNIFVYSFDQNAPKKAKVAGRLIREGLTTGKSVISYQVVQEFFNVALRRFATPMTTIDAERYLQTVFAPMTTIYSSPGLYAEALGLHARHQISWYDSLIMAAAIEARCDCLLSEDLQHGQKFGGVRVRNPFL
jgi:predicted nucleic acid-binding protein